TGTGYASHVGADNNHILRNASFAEMPCQNGHSHEVVHGAVEKSLQLSAVQIHCKHPVYACCLQKVGNKFCGNGVPCTGFSVLTGVSEIGNYRRDSSCGSTFHCVDDDEQVHQIFICGTARGLNDENIATTHRFFDADRCFTVGKTGNFHLS